MELPRGARMDAGAFGSSVSTGIKRCYCATEDSTNCAREPRWQKILTAKMAKEKISKGEAATETSELGTTRGLDLLGASAESWYDGVYVKIRRRYSGGLTLLANYPVVARSGATHRISARRCSSLRFRKTIMIWRQKRGPPAMCGIDLPSVRSTIFLLGIAPAWCVLSAKTGICPPSTRCRPVSLLRFQCSAILLMPGRLGENPIRVQCAGQPLFPSGTRTSENWFNSAAFDAPPAYTFGDAGRNSIYRPGAQTLDLALVRDFSLTERARFQFPGGILQRSESYEPRHSGSFR